MVQMARGDMARVSIRDVAERAGVSETTVSHALSGRRPVSKMALAKVQEASEELGYRPSRVARSLRGGRTHTIALIVPDICNPFYPALARGLQEAITQAGYRTFVCDADNRSSAEDDLAIDCIEREVDGVVIAPLQAELPEVLLSAHSVPKVVLGSSAVLSEAVLRHANVDVVVSHDELGTRMATEHLIELGHREIGYITAPSQIGPAGRRLSGYRAAMTQAGLTVGAERVAVTSFSPEGGSDGLAMLLAGSVPPTAVVCANDLIALGALHYAQEHGIAVPEALALIGFDDIEAAALVKPRLTTVRNPSVELGRACGALLLDRMEGEYVGGAREVRIATELVIREST
jgi:DNA-binding LacI/PurR family transcriptional regulator